MDFREVVLMLEIGYILLKIGANGRLRGERGNVAHLTSDCLSRIGLS